MRYLAWGSAGLVAAALLALALALAFGGPTPLPMKHSINDPFIGVDFKGMPALSRFTARDGTALAYRAYQPAEGKPERGSVMLVHGSSASSRSVDPLARSFADAGFAVYAFDIRGHGESGTRGHIGYIGQLEDDLEDFMRTVPLGPGPKTLVGFSSGGGFALRVAGGSRQGLFDNYLFMSPYVHYKAATARSTDVAGWASVGTPRLVALMMLNGVGLTALNKLEVVDFAVDTDPHAQLTASYSYALAANFQPRSDYRVGLRAITRPAAVLAGEDDELFHADKFRQVFDEAGRTDIPVTLVPVTGHIALTLSPAGRAAAVAAVQRLDDATVSTH